MSPEKMVTMANQIATFFDTQPGHAPDKIAAHLKDYWEPRMRGQLKSYVETGGAGLRPSVREAVRQL
ncbi:formate dehydrogenase subunit delta [Paracoccus angustae]|uniref:Formate dehydrogenase subunit delta n=1 Tax=Paracoccus angustae TaxID=1671480 RepID=A0ABV7TZM9_9RHOB